MIEMIILDPIDGIFEIVEMDKVWIQGDRKYPIDETIVNVNRPSTILSSRDFSRFSVSEVDMTPC